MNKDTFNTLVLAMRISQQLMADVLKAGDRAYVEKHGPLNFASSPTPDNSPSAEELAENDRARWLDGEDY